MQTASEIRQGFTDFFAKKPGHTVVPSSPVVPFDDPTLMFANAGMNQFKDVFLGTGTRPYKRAANTQKCIRAGGKHNDLDDVGKDTYHHTFFEMLGNWSFGDYFKRDAIAWAWELLTEVWKLDKSRLHVTVFEGDPEAGIPRDDEAAGFWRDVAGVAPENIHLGNKKDNFWEMGDTGPCGPCTEIHIDLTPGKTGGPLVNKGTPEVIEIWNLVFIQFNRNPDRSLTPLPAKHVDTGMGFERVTAVIQGKTSNYDTDVFAPLFAAIREVTKAPAYTGKLESLPDTAYRVIADHLRMMTFALTDGAVPSNIGRGYVIRSVIRRAERYGWQVFGTKEPFLHALVPALVEQMGTAFPELRRDPAKVRRIIYEEETSFLRTLERGIKLFNSAAKTATKTIDAKTAFDLHTEQGIFIDITEQMAAEAGLKVDRAGYEKLFEEFKIISAQGRKKLVVTAVKGELPTTDDAPKYQPQIITAKVLGWVKDSTVIREGSIGPGESVALVLDRTNFYAEQGGQVGDRGVIRSADGADFVVDDCQKLGDAVLHIGAMDQGRLQVGDAVTVSQTIGPRVDVMRNHTATHLMNLGLRQVLGHHVEQKGSLVDADKTRFDFSHDKPMTADEIRGIEEIVNKAIIRDLPVTAVTMPLAEAKKLPGVRAVFGEKYPDPVRVIMIGAETPAAVTADESVEFCGGTHVPQTGLIGLFKITSQEAVAKGVRRVTATTGRVSYELMQERSTVLDELAGRFQCLPGELSARVEALQLELKELQAHAKKAAAGGLATAIDALFAKAETVNAAKLVVGVIPAAGADVIRDAVDRLRSKGGDVAIVLGWDDGGKAGLLVAASDVLVKAGVHSGKIVGEAAKLVDGKGGGNPTLAQAGGRNAAGLDAALKHAAGLVRTSLVR